MPNFKNKYYPVEDGYRMLDHHQRYFKELDGIHIYICNRLQNFSIKNGTVNVYSRHWWDGASGPTFDSDSSMEASLWHDIFYFLIEHHFIGKRDPKKFRKWADKVFYNDLKRGGMWFPRARVWFRAVRLFGWMYVR